MRIPSEFATAPCVFAVRDTYEIHVPVTCECVMWVKVGERCFYDDYNGVLRSATTLHRMRVPMALLDSARHYTVCYRTMPERKPYFTVPGEEQHYDSDFYPVEGDSVRICHIADAHNQVAEPVAAGQQMGGIDLLVLNGDIPNHAGKLKYFTAVHEIAAGLVAGERPVVFARGNHDTRGICAELFGDYTPTDNGRTYYTFRLGKLWGMVLDCGEDKPDKNAEYGCTTCFEDFRRRETAFIREVIANADKEYAMSGVENRIVIAHIPFTQKFEPPFDIEEDTYREWCRLLREEIHPQLMLCGHKHDTYLTRVGEPRDAMGQPCPVIVAAKPGDGYYVCGDITLCKDSATLRFVSNTGEVTGEEEIVF